MVSLSVPHESITVVTAICLALATTSVSLRIWVRARFLTSGLQADDWTILIATIGFVGFCVVAFVLASEMAANPVFSAETGEGVITTLLVGEVVFQATCLVFKLSLTLFFRKFLIDEWQRHLVLAAGFFYCCTCVVGVTLALFQCDLPVNLMHKHLTHQCVKQPAFTGLLYVHGVMSAITDWIFALLPTITLYRSNLSRAAKISSSCLLLLACGGSIAAIARTAVTGPYILRPEYFDPNRRPNYYAVSAPIINLTILELGLGITAVSLACLRPLARCIGSIGQQLTSRFLGTDISKSSVTDEEANVNLVAVNTKQEYGFGRSEGTMSPPPNGSSWNRTPALAVAVEDEPQGHSRNETPRLDDLGGLKSEKVPNKPCWHETPRLGDAGGLTTSKVPNKPSWNETPRLKN